MGPTVTTSFLKSRPGKKANAKKPTSVSARASAEEVKNGKDGRQQGVRNARSEIDEIFSSGGQVGESVSSSSAAAAAMVVVKKKNKKKSKKVDEEKVEGDGEREEWRGFGGDSLALDSTPKVETVLDPSTRPTSSVWDSKKRKRVAVGGESSVNKRQSRVKNDDEGERFKDSRGTGPRRQTEEGYSIYKEDELGIGDTGGDTPLCPFDCDCCF